MSQAKRSASVNWNGPQPAPIQVSRILRAGFPVITRSEIYNNRDVAGTTKKSSHAEGRGLDVYLNAKDPNQKVLGDQLFRVLIAEAPTSGIDNVIWNRQIWGTSRSGPRRYAGVHMHEDHIHIEFTREGSPLAAFRRLQLAISILRTNLEEIHQSRKHIA